MADKKLFRKTKTAVNDKIDFLREVTTALLDEVKALGSIKTLEVKNGINFDEEVKRFEIFLIESALSQSGGSQLKASRLLNIKHTTLNAKIKRYQISPISRYSGGQASGKN